MNDAAARPGRGRAWLALAALLALGSVAVAALPAAPAARWLDWQPGLAGSQPWRWWSAAFVHLSALHLGANLVGVALVAALGRAAGCDGRAAAAWALAWPLTHLALAMQPGLLHYGGLSGVLHAGVAVVALRLVVHERGARRVIGAALAAGLVLKVLLESPWSGPLRQAPGWDIPVAPLAHAAGAAAGALCALGSVAMQRRGPFA